MQQVVLGTLQQPAADHVGGKEPDHENGRGRNRDAEAGHATPKARSTIGEVSASATPKIQMSAATLSASGTMTKNPATNRRRR